MTKRRCTISGCCHCPSQHPIQKLLVTSPWITIPFPTCFVFFWIVWEDVQALKDNRPRCCWMKKGCRFQKWRFSIQNALVVTNISPNFKHLRWSHMLSCYTSRGYTGGYICTMEAMLSQATEEIGSSYLFLLHGQQPQKRGGSEDISNCCSWAHWNAESYPHLISRVDGYTAEAGGWDLFPGSVTEPSAIWYRGEWGRRVPFTLPENLYLKLNELPKAVNYYLSPPDLRDPGQRVAAICHLTEDTGCL